MNPPEGDDRPAGPEGPPAIVDGDAGTSSGPAAADQPDDPEDDPRGGDPLAVTLVDGIPQLAHDADDVDADDDAEDRPPRRRVLRWSLATVALLLVAALVAGAFVRVPYYRLAPGSLYATQHLVSVEGAPSFPLDGDGPIDFTTVSSRKASVLDYLLAGFDDAVELKDAADFEHGQTPEENRRENLEMMASSKQMAETAALRKLGYTVKVTGTGALVKALIKDRDGRDLPVAAALRPNDTIVAVDGQPVQLGEDAVAILSQKRPGDAVAMTVESAPGEPGREVTTTLVSRCQALQPQDCTPEEEARPLLGVSLSNRDTRFELPFKVDIDTKDVGGPSAGLALTLGIIDVLTPGSLTGGRRVATTGTIDPNGNVGPVGGVEQKAHLVVRAGIPLFLVPPGDTETAQAVAAGTATKVVEVRTIDDALQALADNGGSTAVVAEEAAARTGTTEADSSH